MGHRRKQEISFFMTTRCNLNCVYCYTPKCNVREEHAAIDVQFAKRGIDDFFRNNPNPAIRFYSVGEPTLEFARMKEIKEYASEVAGSALTVELQTNGVFSHQIRDWILDNVDILWISCDGPAHIQDRQRPLLDGGDSSGVVEENMKFFIREGSDMKVGARVTLTASTIHKQVELVEYFHDLGIQYMSVEPASPPTGGLLDESLTTDPADFAAHFTEAYKRALQLGMTYLSLTMVNFDEEVTSACRSCIPYPQLTTDGYVSCCDYGTFGPEYLPGPLQNFIYGKYDAATDSINYDTEKIKAIQSRCSVLSKSTCKDCPVLKHCMGGCMGEAVNVSGDLYGIKEYSCQVTRQLWELLPRQQSCFPVLHS